MVDTDQLCAEHSILNWVSTELAPHARNEVSGPCPKCGGDDRFVVNDGEGWWMCRQCHQQRGDVIGLVSWLYDLEFMNAVARLTDAPPVTDRPKRRKKKKRKPSESMAEWLLDYTLECCGDYIGSPGRDYMISRGVTDDTAMLFSLGWDKSKECVTIPWILEDDKTIVGVRRRFIDPSLGPKDRMRSVKGSILEPLFGLQHRRKKAKHLFLIEGEINAMSVRQVGEGYKMDAFAYGSERTEFAEPIVKIAESYKNVIVWGDRKEMVTSLADQLGAQGICLPNGHGDANTLLTRGILSDFVDRLITRR